MSATPPSATTVATRGDEAAATRVARGRAWARTHLDLLGLGALLVAALGFHGYNRWHLSFGPWDESVHAVVAEHLALHPLHPTLYEVAALVPVKPDSFPYWIRVQTWLHIPPFGMWMGALSMRVLGDTPFALRLPGLCFILLGMVVTFLLGRRLFGPWVGLAGAAFAGFAPYALMISQGYMFGDITDTPLMLFVPLALLLLVKGYQSGQLRWVALAGVCQGICYLTKGALGLAPTGVALALCACDWLFPREDGWYRLRLRGLAVFAVASVVVAAPYSLYTARAFPAAAGIEATMLRLNVTQSVENWGQPTDMHFTQYLYALYGPALALLLLSAGVTVAAMAYFRRSRADTVIVVWIAALYLPLSVAVTKAPNMTYAAVPGIGLAVGRFVALGFTTRSRWARAAIAGVLAGTAVMALLFMAHVLSDASFGYANVVPSHYRLGSLSQRLLPYVEEGGLSLAAAALYLAASAWLRSPRGREVLRRLSGIGARRAAMVSLGVVVVILAAYWVRYDLQAVARPTIDAGPEIRLGHYLEAHTPANATVLIVTNQEVSQVANYQLRLTFWSHRDVYSTEELQGHSVCELAGYAAQAASPFFVVADYPMAGREVGTVDTWMLLQPDCQ